MGHFVSKLLRKESSDSFGMTPDGVLVSLVEVPLTCRSMVRMERTIFRRVAMSLLLCKCSFGLTSLSDSIIRATSQQCN